MSLDRHPLVSHWLGLRDGRLIIRSGKVDLGQRISTALAEIAHEELTVPHDRIDIAPVRTGASPDEGMTSGSNSVQQSGGAVRLAAATLRREAARIAAERMGGRPEDWTLNDGGLLGPGTNRPIPLLDLVRETDLEIAVDPEAQCMPARVRPAAPVMRGLHDMVTGRHVFLHDMEWPGMLHARVVRPPHARARLAAAPAGVIGEIEACGMHVVRDGSFLAVAGPREWPAITAAERLGAACRWSSEGGLPEVDACAGLVQENATRLLVRDGTPRDDPIPPLPAAPNHAARYERPFTLHGALAPSAAMAVWDGTRLAITTHSQGIYPLRESIADSLGLDSEQVEVSHAPGSGCYGHNGADDAAFDAALVAIALPGTPVLLKWSREEEHCWEPFGPPQAVELAAWTDGAGRIARLSAEAISGTYRGRPRPGPGRAGPARLLANRFRRSPADPYTPAPNMGRQGGMHRNLDPAYTIPETRLVKNLVTNLPHRTSALRCLGAAANVFALESLMDEIARAEGRDPLAFRRAHLEDPRAVALLDRLGDAMQALPALGPGGGCGIAYAQYKNAMARVAAGVHITVADDARIRLDRAILVVDAGRVVDRHGLEAQIEGGFLHGASWALHEEVAWDRNGIVSRDWQSYPVLRFDNVPEMEVIVLDHRRAPTLGAGEAASGPAVAAIANALFDATGLRLRRLPLNADAIRRAALA